MKNANRFETKIWTAITAICSSILTSLLTDLISSNSYTILEKDKQLVIQDIPMSLYDLIVNYLKLIVVFFIIWLSLNTIVYITSKIYRKVHVKKLGQINEKEMSTVLETAKQRTMTLYERLEKRAFSDVKNCYIKMNLKELSSIILLLYSYFSRPDMKGKENLRKICRKSTFSSLPSISNGISYYELEGTFKLLKLIIVEAISVETDDELLKKDCIQMDNLLNEMVSIFQISEVEK